MSKTSVAVPCRYAIHYLILVLISFLPAAPAIQQTSDFLTTQSTIQNSFEDNTIDGSPQYVACGTIATNFTTILVRNPHHPEPTFTKSICETVIERLDPTINKLSIRFKQLELYRPTSDGQCIHDRFAIYTDLNAVVTPVICGNHTGEVITIPFLLPHTSLIVSVTTSDLDHDRFWAIEIEQEK